MASRESQGLQIALILFVMVTVVLAVTTYFFFRQAEEQTKQAVAARQEAETSKKTTSQLDFENQILKHVIGVGTKAPAELASIKQGLGENKEIEELLLAFDQDMATYGAGLSDPKNYQLLPGHLMDQVNRRNTDLTESDAKITALQERITQLDKEKSDILTKAADDLRKERETYAAQVTNFGRDRVKFTTAASNWQTQIQQKINEIKNLETTSATTLAERETELRNLRESHDQTREDLAKAMKPQEYEHPDGQIVYVNQRADLVWIDLGSADGLRRQMTFSVYDQNQVGATNAETKASVQVTAVKDSHSAEARILEHDLGNPIMVGDKIYSPTFRKGQTTRFALAGFLDIDGDGKSDQKKVKSIITTNGGEVDAELLEDGSIAGKITLDTRYLVRGEAPTDKTDEQRITGWNTMLDEASLKGLETMPLDELLARMGYHDDSRVINLRRGGPGGSGTKGTRPPKIKPPEDSEGKTDFRKRRPSAYP